VPPLAGIEPKRDGPDGTDKKAPYQDMVRRIGPKELARSDDAPQDAAVEVHPCNRARETIQSLRGTDIRDINKHPIKHHNLRDRRHHRRGHLHTKQDPRRDFHVMAQLQIGTELDALGGRDVPVGDEDHVCDWPAGEEDAADELADQVDAAVLVCDGHDDGDGDEEEGADGEGEEEAVPGEVDRVALVG
jgi:hypothetical protein